jgi:hypothetical protein
MHKIGDNAEAPAQPFTGRTQPFANSEISAESAAINTNRSIHPGTGAIADAAPNASSRNLKKTPGVNANTVAPPSRIAGNNPQQKTNITSPVNAMNTAGGVASAFGRRGGVIGAATNLASEDVPGAVASAARVVSPKLNILSRALDAGKRLIKGDPVGAGFEAAGAVVPVVPDLINTGKDFIENMHQQSEQNKQFNQRNREVRGSLEARNTGIADADGNVFVNTNDAVLLYKLGFEVADYDLLEKTSEILDLYSYVEKLAGVPKEVAKLIDEDKAFSSEYLKEMGYNIPKGYEVKGDLCCPSEKAKKEEKRPSEKTASEKPRYYHGSETGDITKLTPQESRVLENAKAVFGTDDRDVALSFARRWRDSDIQQGSVDGKYYMREQYPGAFEKIFKGPGYVYELEDSGFKHDPRLTKFERYSDKDTNVIKKEYIEDVLEALKKSKFALQPYKEKTASEEDYVFTHYNPHGKHKELRPLTYLELLKDRSRGRWEDKPELAQKYVDDRKEFEATLGKELLEAGLPYDPEKSFLYGAVDGHERFGQPGTYKHLADMPDLDKTFFTINGLDDKDRIKRGKQGLLNAIKLWVKNQDKLKDTEYMGMTIRPRVEVMTQESVTPYTIEKLKEKNSSVEKQAGNFGQIAKAVANVTHSAAPAAAKQKAIVKQFQDAAKIGFKSVYPTAPVMPAGTNPNKWRADVAEGMQQHQTLSRIRQDSPGHRAAFSFNAPNASGADELHNVWLHPEMMHTNQQGKGIASQDRQIVNALIENTQTGQKWAQPMYRSTGTNSEHTVGQWLPTRGFGAPSEDWVNIVKTKINPEFEMPQPVPGVLPQFVGPSNQGRGGLKGPGWLGKYQFDPTTQQWIVHDKTDTGANALMPVYQRLREAMGEYMGNIGLAKQGSQKTAILRPEHLIAGGIAATSLGALYLNKKNNKKRPSEKTASKDKPGLWANIHAKRKRGEKAAKPGDEDYPDKKQWDKLSKEGAADPAQTILVTGHSGAGKSTLAKALAEKLNIPLHRVDAQESWDNLRADLESRPDYERLALTPGTSENQKYIKDIRKIVGKSLKEMEGPSVLEGTQVTTLGPRQLRKYMANVLVGGDVEQSIAQRLQRMKDKAAKKGITLSPEDLDRKMLESRMVADSWSPGMEKFKKVPGVINYNHTEHEVEPLVEQLRALMSKEASAWKKRLRTGNLSTGSLSKILDESGNFQATHSNYLKRFKDTATNPLNAKGILAPANKELNKNWENRSIAEDLRRASSNLRPLKRRSIFERYKKYLISRKNKPPAEKALEMARVHNNDDLEFEQPGADIVKKLLDAREQTPESVKKFIGKNIGFDKRDFISKGPVEEIAFIRTLKDGNVPLASPGVGVMNAPLGVGAVSSRHELAHLVEGVISSDERLALIKRLHETFKRHPELMEGISKEFDSTMMYEAMAQLIASKGNSRSAKKFINSYEEIAKSSKNRDLLSRIPRIKELDPSGVDLAVLAQLMENYHLSPSKAPKPINLPG